MTCTECGTPVDDPAFVLRRIVQEDDSVVLPTGVCPEPESRWCSLDCLYVWAAIAGLEARL